ncbi:unnamed protein product [Diatraea saccharalis]|uniref:Uncharacterized protein n=1 Tax=Diatraea saccharalis TaxID=40085 RepID=A0A9N9R151_9NEOP|nr:unnamed protein product [Diatraea saccharalis]
MDMDLEHGPKWSGTYSASMSAIHLYHTESEGMNSGTAPRVSGAAPPNLPACGTPVEAEPVSANLDGWFSAFAQAVTELPWEARKRKWETQSWRRICWITTPCN